ncbi:hypothetical protein J2S67_001183 [Pseudoglutamicibacter albus]|uniref:Uncharacterized protein n=1 Tax=Pseudoglutamicibacter albus TaxID=98671 RepID=A0ABU1YZY4_9MICC|nr:hypothetical protein [Pseudoglutamicibacter albus]
MVSKEMSSRINSRAISSLVKAQLAAWVHDAEASLI